jgi:hypothetical protein
MRPERTPRTASSPYGKLVQTNMAAEVEYHIGRRSNKRCEMNAGHNPAKVRKDEERDG